MILIKVYNVLDGSVFFYSGVTTAADQIVRLSCGHWVLSYMTSLPVGYDPYEQNGFCRVNYMVILPIRLSKRRKLMRKIFALRRRAFLSLA